MDKAKFDNITENLVLALMGEGKLIVTGNENNEKISRVLKLLAPYIAVGIFWCGFSNGWLAILAYHLQVLLWAHHENRQIKRLKNRCFMLLALPTLVAGPAIYFLLPYSYTHISFPSIFRLRFLVIFMILLYYQSNNQKLTIMLVIAI